MVGTLFIGSIKWYLPVDKVWILNHCKTVVFDKVMGGKNNLGSIGCISNNMTHVQV